MNKETRQFIWGLLHIGLGIVLMDYGINRMNTNQEIWLGMIQFSFGFAIIIFGVNYVNKVVK